MGSLGTIAGATTLAEAIHAIWAANAALCAVIPLERFCTGRIPPSEEMPYVRVEFNSNGNVALTNRTLYQKGDIVLHIWTDDFDTGDAIAGLVRQAFDLQEFDWITGGVLNFRLSGTPNSTQTTIPEIKAWETIASFSANIWEKRSDISNGSSSSGV